VFVAAGDWGAAVCDLSGSATTRGIAVNGLASTPNNVAVGGTDFGDGYTQSQSVYWTSTNSPAYGSAKSYIPEIPWNDSCAGQLLATYEGFSDPTVFCNSPAGQRFLMTIAGSGGPSAVYAKPPWQSGLVGVPSDGARDLPDVSLFAANGLWGHYYVFCWSDKRYGGIKCGNDPSAWSGAGGTSFSSPIMAGIQALVNQKKGAPQGNPNPRYYQLAAGQYGATGNAACDSSTVTGGNSCVFYDVTAGDMDLDCIQTTNNCLTEHHVGIYGRLSMSNKQYSPAFGTNIGWDAATGIGTVNAYNLVTHW
jgi:subtilase family serine protease